MIQDVGGMKGKYTFDAIVVGGPKIGMTDERSWMQS
jgi:hypothetical protein